MDADLKNRRPFLIDKCIINKHGNGIADIRFGCDIDAGAEGENIDNDNEIGGCEILNSLHAPFTSNIEMRLIEIRQA